MGVDADLDLAPHRRDDGRGRLGDVTGQAAAVGVAEGDVLGPGVGRRRHAFERVGGVFAVAVEEVLGVEERPLALLAAEGDRVGDHRQVLLAADPDHLLDVQRRALADQADRPARRRPPEPPAPVVLGGGAVAAAGHPEGDDRRLLQLGLAEPLEELGFLRVAAGKAGLDEVDPERVEGLGDLELLADRERHAAPAHAVAQGRVVELYLFHRYCLSSRRRSGGPEARCARTCRASR